jgi:orotidine-5'-phosphate decarboxylase
MAELTTSRAVHPIVALDVPDAAEARSLVTRLGGACDFYKVGLELFTAEGPAVVRWLRDEGKSVFLDLKLHDIPNTVRSAARNVARLGASLVTVHAAGGTAMMRAAVEGAREGGATETGCGVLGVTILTSHDGASIGAAWGRDPVDVEREVLRLAADVRTAGGVGVVCSGHEAAAVHATHGSELGLLIPGIRLLGGSTHDQKRVMTPAAAADAGARWIILGRAVTESADPVAAMAAVRDELMGRI